MRKILIGAFLVSNFLMANDTFTNTNNIQNNKSLKDLIKWTLSGQNPKRVKIEISDEWKSIAPDSKGYAVWIGHATFLIKLGNTTIITDPFFSKNSGPLIFGPKRYVDPAIQLDQLPKTNLLLLSHNHYDHLDYSTIKNFPYKDTLALAPLKLGKY